MREQDYSITAQVGGVFNNYIEFTINGNSKS